jgi:GT2 family glycosyltransferase
VRLSIVIPTVGRPESLGRVLEHLERQEAGGFEALVVRDPGDPARYTLPAQRSFPVRELWRHPPGAPEPRNVSAARNVGWRQADSPLILFLDDDVLPRADLVAQHLAWHDSHPEPEVGVLGLVRWAPELRLTPFMRWLEAGIQFDYEAIRGSEAGWGRFYTANASVKREMLDRVDGFDERFPFHYEDLDLAYRMSRHGFRLLFNRAAVGDHLHAVTVESYRRRVAGIAAAERRFVSVHPDVEPHFHRLFREAARHPPLRGRGARLARYVPPWLPWLGPRTWSAADLYFRQQLAADFLAAWDAAADGDPSAPEPARAG